MPLWLHSLVLPRRRPLLSYRRLSVVSREFRDQTLEVPRHVFQLLSRSGQTIDESLDRLRPYGFKELTLTAMRDEVVVSVASLELSVRGCVELASRVKEKTECAAKPELKSVLLSARLSGDKCRNYRGRGGQLSPERRTRHSCYAGTVAPLIPRGRRREKTGGRMTHCVQ